VRQSLAGSKAAQRFVLFAGFVLAAVRLSAAPNPFETDAVLRPENRIDELVFEKLARIEVQPAKLSSDAAFVRRVYLDAVGTLPTAKEAEAFLFDKNANKRRVLIDRLLEREEFADYWAMKWGDLLRVKAEFPINLWPNAAQECHRWIRESARSTTCGGFPRLDKTKRPSDDHLDIFFGWRGVKRPRTAR
jgi:hypothetical protein